MVFDLDDLNTFRHVTGQYVDKTISSQVRLSTPHAGMRQGGTAVHGVRRPTTCVPTCQLLMLAHTPGGTAVHEVRRLPQQRPPPDGLGGDACVGQWVCIIRTGHHDLFTINAP